MSKTWKVTAQAAGGTKYLVHSGRSLRTAKLLAANLRRVLHDAKALALVNVEEYSPTGYTTKQQIEDRTNFDPTFTEE